jgi:hypothetical protein
MPRWQIGESIAYSSVPLNPNQEALNPETLKPSMFSCSMSRWQEAKPLPLWDQMYIMWSQQLLPRRHGE